jgi:hypothetical protein
MSQIKQRREFARAVGAMVLVLIAVQPIIAGNPIPATEVSSGNKNAAPLITDHKTVRCSLQEGETTFILPLPKASMLDGFKFVNENPAVRGELQIAVSDSCLPANDPKWNAVDGKIAFANKRLFNLSMLGVNAKYVKLSFRVEKDSRIAAVGF